MDFYDVEYLDTKKINLKIAKPYFINKPNKDIMVKGGKFYAIWDKENSIWSTSIYDVVRIVDEGVNEIVKKKQECDPSIGYKQYYMENNNTHILDDFYKWCSLQDDNFKPLNCIVKFNNEKTKRNDYCSFKLPYDIGEGPMDAYNELIDTLYEPEERDKLEWAIGSVIAGESIFLEKAIALYGGPRTGKSTVLKIISKMFTLDNTNNYVGSITTNNLVKQTDRFSAAPLKDYKLILFDNDANLTKVDDNSILNKIISHEPIKADMKYGKDEIVKKPVSFLFLATNSYIGMTDAKSGLKRRFIVVQPSNNLVPKSRYDKLMKQINNELGAIAYHCKEKYLSMGIEAYDDYESTEMYEYSNSLFGWISDNMDYELKDKFENGISLNDAWDYYKNYCTDSGFNYGKKGDFKVDMQEYFDVAENININGRKHRYFYTNLKRDKFVTKNKAKIVIEGNKKTWLDLEEQHSLLDDVLKDCPAQLQDDKETRPSYKWINCKTTVSDIDTSKVHYVKVPLNHIVIDFDIKGGDGGKSFELNKNAARLWPETYAELSKSGEGIHLHYIYDGGNPEELNRLYDTDIEVKVFTGDASLRRKLTKCNDIPIAHLSVGDLELREKKVLKTEGFESLHKTENVIKKALRKENTGYTATEVSLIKKVLDDAYDSGISYDFTSYKHDIILFASDSTHQSEECLKMVSKMKFHSDDVEEANFVQQNTEEYEEAPLVFFDIECFPNLFLINWKYAGEGKSIVRMINPNPEDVKKLFNFRLVGFNNRDYDNHMIWAASQGYSNIKLYNLSTRLVNDDKNISREAKFMQAYGLSYTDIYDYAKKKQSLKKWEIELGIHHQELGLPWDQPVPKSEWSKVSEYCDNDVIATEAVWNATQGDFKARLILAEIASGTPNDKTNKLSELFIFEGNKHPQAEFNYRNMGEPEPGHTYTIEDDGITCWQDDGKPIFLGYKCERGVSSYLDVEEVGEGGYVFAEIGNNSLDPEEAGGMYGYTITLDISGQHPASAIAENLFGDYYTPRYKEIIDLRLAIKHGELDRAKEMFNGQLSKYLDDPESADALSGALKIVVNAVYGLTSAKFDNAFRDKRNTDNIVAKRGALFMINLRNLVQRKGYTVAHCKTDSIKIVNPDDYIINFVVEYGKKFGYTFEVEHIFDKICLVNNAVYIAKLSKDDPSWIKDCNKAKEKGEPEPTRWTATGTQFQQPYLFKTLFSHEPIEFKDMCETKSLTRGGMIYLDFNESLPDVTMYEKCLKTMLDIANNKKTTQKAVRELDELGLNEAQLKSKIEKGHDYQFIGKVGLFCPIKPGCGGGIMYRHDPKTDAFNAVTGTKGYRWMESEIVEKADLQDNIDIGYYNNLVNEAITDISAYGDYEWFIS